MTTASVDSAVLNRLIKLLAIPGPSCQEGRVARWVARQLVAAGVDQRCLHFDAAHRRTPQAGEVGNLSLKLPSNGQRGPRRMFVAHLDTVPICAGSRPKVDAGRVRSSDPATGLGADDRAGVAVLLETVLRLLRQRPSHPPLTFLWTVQEEIGLQGARLASLSPLGRPTMAFNWDGGQATKLTIGATGGYRMTIRIRGKASHAGGAPQEGINAITIASLAIAQLHQEGWLGRVRRGHWQGTSNVGEIHGGSATNVVADQVTLHAEARSHSPTFRRRIVKAFHTALNRAATKVRNAAGQRGSVQVDGRLDYEAFCLRPQEPVVQTAVRTIERLGLTSELAVANGGLDANWLCARGIATVTLGCGQLHQHTVDEALDLREFGRALQIAWQLATEPIR